jgi:hypothetical protein
MQQSILYQTAVSLSPLERKHFGLWIGSAFFNKKAGLTALWAYLQACLDKKAIPTADEALQKTGDVQVWYKRAPMRAQVHEREQALRLLMSELLEQMEHFLVHKAFFADESAFFVQLAGQYRQRNLEKTFHQTLKAGRKALEKQPYRHAEYLSAKSALTYEEYQFASTRTRTEPLNLQSLIDDTDAAFLAQKLRLACFALSHQAVFKTDYDLGLLEPLLQYVAQKPALLQLPAVGLYFHCYWLLTRPDDDAPFNEFKRDLLTQMSHLPVEEQRNLHLFAINFCVRRINRSEAAYYPEVLELYQSALRANLLIENGVLSQFAFNNIVAIALKTNELDWAEGFVAEYHPYLEKKYREPVFHLNMARIAYTRRQHSAALLHLQQAEYRDLINNLTAKTLQLKIYYETAEWDALDAHLQSMKTYLTRRRAIGYHKTNYQNIIRYTQRLLRCNLHDRQEKAALEVAIRQEAVLTEKAWLLEQLQR